MTKLEKLLPLDLVDGIGFEHLVGCGYQVLKLILLHDDLPGAASDLLSKAVAAAEPEPLVEPSDHQRSEVDFELRVRTGKNEHLRHGAEAYESVPVGGESMTLRDHRASWGGLLLAA
jgi:hypothetical protein